MPPSAHTAVLRILLLMDSLICFFYHLADDGLIEIRFSIYTPIQISVLIQTTYNLSNIIQFCLHFDQK